MCRGCPEAAPYSYKPTNRNFPPSPVFNAVGVKKHFASISDCSQAQVVSGLASANAAAACPTTSYCTLATQKSAAANLCRAKCCAAVAAHTTNVLAGLGVLGTLYETAKAAYSSARVCGHDWSSWKASKSGVEGLPAVHERGSFEHSYSKILYDAFIGADCPSEPTKPENYDDPTIDPAIKSAYDVKFKEYQDCKEKSAILKVVLLVPV